MPKTIDSIAMLLKIKDANPRLKEMPSETVKSHYELCCRYAPTVASEPLLIGPFLVGIIQMGQFDVRAMVVLIEAERAMAAMRKVAEGPVAAIIQESYKQMFEESEDLKEWREDPVRSRIIDRNFGILAEVAPSIAAMPAVAATWVRSTSIHPHIEHTQIGQLAEVQLKIDQMHESHRGGGPHEVVEGGRVLGRKEHRDEPTT